MKADVVIHIPLKHKHILLHLPYGPPELLLAEPADVHPVDINIPPLNVVIPANQV